MGAGEIGLNLLAGITQNAQGIPDREVADGWVVFGWVGSTCSVVASNGDTIDACDYGVPQVPAGASVRSFVTTMFKSGSK